MKKLLLFFAFLIVLAFSSCTELEDDSYENETFAIDKYDSTTPGADGGEDPDDTED